MNLLLINVPNDKALRIVNEQISEGEKLLERSDIVIDSDIISWWDLTEGQLSTIDGESRF